MPLAMPGYKTKFLKLKRRDAISFLNAAGNAGQKQKVL
jgi:hypothetical protein